MMRFDGNGTSSARLKLRLGIISFIVLFSGCSRSFWRKQADQDAYNLLIEKTADERWNVPRIDVTPDTRSRFYDPFDLDKEPLPPDDPSAAEYMQQVAGMRGYKSWHKFGDVFSVENPQWMEQFALQQNVKLASAEQEEGGKELPPETVYGIENLTLQQALELSTIHSRDYQDQIENLFLRALTLTFDRFQFGVRYLGVNGGEPSVNLDHSSVPQGANNLTLNNRFGISQALPAGGQWAVELANRTLWFFSGENGISTASTLSYSIVQPLLFQAGRKVALEGLTQSERNVLYSARDLARFRKSFFVSVVGGGSGFLGILLQKQRVENQKRNIERTLFQLKLIKEEASQRSSVSVAKLEKLPKELLPTKPEDGTIKVNLLFQRQLQYNPRKKKLKWMGIMLPMQYDFLRKLSTDKAYLAALDNLNQNRTYVDLDILPQGATLPRSVTVNQQATYDANAKVFRWKGPMSQQQEKDLLAMSNDVTFQTAITKLIRMRRAESFSTDVLNLESNLLSSQNDLRDAERIYQDLLDNFKFLLGLPPDFHLTIDTSLLNQFQFIDNRLTSLENRIKEFVFVWATLDENHPDADKLKSVVDGLKNLQKLVQTTGLNLVEEDSQRVLQNREKRLARLKDDGEIDLYSRNLARDRRMLEGVKADFSAFDTKIRNFPDKQSKKSPERQIGDLREELLKISQTLQVIQIGLRVELIDIKEFTMSMGEAVSEGMKNRLDLMNARGDVMDARRSMEIAANRLQAVLNLQVDGDIRTRQDNKPLDFRGRQSDFRVGIGFTAPLDLVNERNAYRNAQIAYQRARRDYMAIEDQIKLQIRGLWRQLQNLEKNFETARQRVRIAAMQFDKAAEDVVAPNQTGGNLSLNLIQALDAVLAAQNSLVINWVNYERNRLNIFRDMGIMNIDARGIWDDDIYRIDDPGNSSPTENPSPKSFLPHDPEGPRDHEPAELGARKPAFSNIGDVRGSVLVSKHNVKNHATRADYRSIRESRRNRIVLTRGVQKPSRSQQ